VPKPNKRVLALDGVRGIAILLVVAEHFGTNTARGTTWFRYGGFVGVTLFFVLSGYLISTLLLTEKARRGAIDYRAFYIRRALRLLPALLAFLIVTPIIYWVVGDPRLHSLPKYSLEVLFYLGDFVRASGRTLAAYDHTWSLSVEEQFYLLWPIVISGLLILAAATRRSVTKMIFALTLLAVIWRLVAAYHYGFGRVYFAPDTNAFALLFGCTLAAWTQGRVKVERELRGLVWITVVAVVAAATFPSIALLTTDLTIIRYTGPVVGLLGLALVYAARNSNHWLLANPVLTSFGKISYAWYLWHQMLLTVMPNGHPLTPEGRVLAVLASYVAAWISWFLVERSALRLKHRFDRTEVPATERAPLVAVPEAVTVPEAVAVPVVAPVPEATDDVAARD
jgi:peptidoglycan/LPS O-acetylase OafA/YrhL